MICKECKKQMILDDRDYHFKGNMDKYWLCEHCHTTCIEEIRFNQSFKEHWTLRYFNTLFHEYMIIKEFTIKHVIDTSIRIKKGEL